MLGITAVLLMLRQRWPAGLTIWVYYWVVVAPVSGVAHSGPQIAADRYTYLACLGWAILAGAGSLYVWRLRISGKIRPRTVLFMNGFAMMGLIVLGTLTWRQAEIWRDSETLWRHVLAIDPKANYAHSSLGNVLYKRGELKEAIEHYRIALQISPDALVYHNLGIALAQEGRRDEAKESYLNAIRLKPDLAAAHANLGDLFGKEGRLEEARRHYQEAIRSDPNAAGAHHSLALALAHQGMLIEAIPHFRKAIELSPGSADIYLSYGTALAKEGPLDEAINQFQQALADKPGAADAYHNLGTVMGVKAISSRRSIISVKLCESIPPT